MHIFPLDSIYLLAGVPITSLYCNTLLANLNARVYLQGEPSPYFIDTTDLIGMSDTGHNKRNAEPTSTPSVNQVG